MSLYLFLVADLSAFSVPSFFLSFGRRHPIGNVSSDETCSVQEQGPAIIRQIAYRTSASPAIERAIVLTPDGIQ